MRQTRGSAHTRELARIEATLNQIARWANDLTP